LDEVDDDTKDSQAAFGQALFERAPTIGNDSDDRNVTPCPRPKRAKTPTEMCYNAHPWLDGKHERGRANRLHERVG